MIYYRYLLAVELLIGLTCNISALSTFFPTDSNIWKELLHLFQGCFLPLDEEYYSVRPVIYVSVRSTHLKGVHIGETINKCVKQLHISPD